jgi:DNA-binding transcriptional MocR family regulator
LSVALVFGGVNCYIVSVTSWSPDLSSHPGPRYAALAATLAADIESGQLPAGTRLPTHRELADVLHVTVGTVTRAYALAAQNGWIEATVGRGTFVRAGRIARKRDAPLEEAIDLAQNRPTLGPQLEALASTLRALAVPMQLAECANYAPPRGHERDRAAGATWISQLGYTVSAESVIVTSGVQSALFAVLSTVAQPGDAVALESLTYPGISALVQQQRLRACAVALDAEGMRVEAFEAVCQRERPRVLIAVPTRQNPTGSVMSTQRRRALAAVAERYDVLIVEDDIYGPLLEPRPAPLSSFAPDRSFYSVGTSKALLPALRIGFLALPAPYIDRVTAALRTVGMASPILAEVTSRWIMDGTAARLLSWQRAEAHARQVIFERVLGRYEVPREASGFHRFIELPEPWKAGAFAEKLREQRILVAPTEAFVVGHGTVPRALRLCISSPPERADLERALTLIADLLAHAPAHAAAVY